ncbi:MAG: HAMP domain-containing histidine kinase [Proteobacteria bacterium]|jgi:signal transduction histidine kinase|nr:HAMP domain-containing histidine kinase [Pseudomonadota bacterium]
MMNFIRRISGSLSFRLMFMFLIGGFALTELMQVALRVTAGELLEQNVLRDAVLYSDLLVDRRTGQVAEELATTLADTRGFDIVLRRGDSVWAVGEPINLDHLHFEPVDLSDLPVPIVRRGRGRSAGSTPYALESDWEDGRFLVRMQSRGYDFILGYDPNIVELVQIWNIIALIGMLGLLYLATHWLFRPLENIRGVVSKIGQGDLGSRTTIDRHDELGKLGAEINQMADDIEGMLEAKRDLFLAISHELRTPVTRSRVAAELIGDTAQREAISADMKEMESLISDLTEAESMSTGHSTLNRQPHSVSYLISTELNEHFANSGVEAPAASSDDYMLLDGMRIQLLLKNLLINSLRHSAPDQPRPTVSAKVNEEGLALVVKDSGEGIDTQHLGRVTEAFYRPDASRQRKTGGFGLGLYLCQNIVSAHGGTMKIDSELGRGTTVTVRIPHKVEDKETDNNV